MTTKLEGDLRRELLIEGQPYKLTISPQGFVLAVKGRRKGLAISWSDLVSGDAAMATALNASLSANIQPGVQRYGPTGAAKGQTGSQPRAARK